MGKGLDRLNAVVGDKQLATATAAVEIEHLTRDMLRQAEYQSQVAYAVARAQGIDIPPPYVSVVITDSQGTPLGRQY